MKELLLLILCSCSLSIFGQTKFGIGLNTFQSTLNHVDTSVGFYYGFSGQEHVIEPTYGFGVEGIFQTKFNNRFSLSYGLGYSHNSLEIHFDFFNTLFWQQITETLEINLHHLQIPIEATVLLYQQTEKSSLIASFGLTSKLLFVQNDNYQKIIWEEIAIGGNKYNSFLLNSQVSIGFSHNISKKRSIQITAFLSRDITPFVKRKGWGFYRDLYTARNYHKGLSIRYYFLKL